MSTRQSKLRARAIAKAQAADPKPYFPAERKTVALFVECGLEAGLSHSDAVKLAVAIYKEIDVLARAAATLDPLPVRAISVIRGYARAIIRSGSTFHSFEIANRAVAAYQAAAKALEKLSAEWNRDTVTARLRHQKIRRDAAAKAMERRELRRSRVSVLDPETGTVIEDGGLGD